MKERTRLIGESIRQNMKKDMAQWVDTSSVFEAFPASAGEPLIVRHALAVQMKFENTPVILWPSQLIAGSIMDPIQLYQISGALPDYATEGEKAAAAKKGVSVSTIIGHIVPSYPKLLKMGTGAIARDAKEKYEAATDADTKAFYKACEIVMDALSSFALRHADMLDEAAKNEGDESRKQELARMAEDLRFAPINPAKTYAQAAQSIWLAHLAFQLTGNDMAIGRFDQHAWPHLKADLDAGRLTMDEAQELTTCFMLKFNERSQHNSVKAKVIDIESINKQHEENWKKRGAFDHTTQRKNARDDLDATNHWLQNVVVGGVKPEDGSDASNPITYMVLEAFDQNRMTNPCLTVRLHEGTPEELYKKSCEVLKNGGGLPAFFNDEGIIPSLTSWGIALEDARDYTNDGCWEIIIAGQNDFYFDRFNMLRCLEWALNHGCSRMDGKKEAPDPGDPSAFESYGAVYDAFLQELYFELNGLMDKNNKDFGRRADIAPVPLLSALLNGPMDLGGDMTKKGAKYITYGLIAEGVSHVIDSLAAIKKVIFEDRQATMAQLIQALDQNFEGHDVLRAKLQAAPKYGRNEREADELGKKLLSDFANKVRQLNQTYTNMTFLPGAGTFSWYIAIGEGLGASPDGRLSGEPVSSNMSPSAGAATRGITGSILSHAAFDMNDLPVGAPNDLRLSAKLVGGDAGMNRLVAVLKSFVNLKGNMLTLTIADTQLLKKAQQEPERYSDLRVRMGGWSAYFTMLSKEQQEYHIQKAEEL